MSPNAPPPDSRIPRHIDTGAHARLRPARVTTTGFFRLNLLMASLVLSLGWAGCGEDEDRQTLDVTGLVQVQDVSDQVGVDEAALQAALIETIQENAPSGVEVVYRGAGTGGGGETTGGESTPQPPTQGAPMPCVGGLREEVGPCVITGPDGKPFNCAPNETLGGCRTAAGYNDDNIPITIIGPDGKPFNCAAGVSVPACRRAAGYNDAAGLAGQVCRLYELLCEPDGVAALVAEACATAAGGECSVGEAGEVATVEFSGIRADVVASQSGELTAELQGLPADLAPTETGGEGEAVEEETTEPETEPAPVEPAPAEPAPAEPAPVEPAPVEPAPAPSEP